jgi:hypothetical protein
MPTGTAFTDTRRINTWSIRALTSMHGALYFMTEYYGIFRIE